MSNTINLIPVRTKDQIRFEIKKFRYDFLTALLIMGFVVFGIVLMFINAYFSYTTNNIETSISKEKATLATYNNLAKGYYVVDIKAKQAKLINGQKLNPTDVITYIQTLLPAGSLLSNFTLSSDGVFNMNVQNSDYIDVAKFLLTLEDPKIKLRNTEIKNLTYDHSQNVILFQISGEYIKDGKK